MSLCVKRVNTLQRSSVKNKYCKGKIQGNVCESYFVNFWQGGNFLVISRIINPHFEYLYFFFTESEALKKQIKISLDTNEELARQKEESNKKYQDIAQQQQGNDILNK